MFGVVVRWSNRFRPRVACAVHAFKQDDGAAALILAAAIAVIAFTALTIYLDRFVGSRALIRARSVSSAQGYLVQAVFAAYLKGGSPFALPCPDTAAAPTGVAGTCNSTGTTSGVLPWQTLGLSQDDVVDAYGDYYSYVVSATAKTMCHTVTDDVRGKTEVTGSLQSATDLSLVAPAVTRNVAFAIIGHGANRKGAKSRNNPTGAGQAASGHELANGASSPSTIYADAYSSSFDDQVFAPSNADMEKICKSLTPGGALNAQMSENFDLGSERSTGTPDSTKFSNSGATVTADARTTSSAGNYVASMSASTAYLATNTTNYNFDAAVRPVYVSSTWIPDPLKAGNVKAGMSIATRATIADLTSGSDIFGSNSRQGVTFRFFDSSLNPDISAVGTANNIYILENTGGTTNTLGTSAATFKLITGKSYTIEAYDDGTNMWGRITQADDLTNTAYVTASSSVDHTGSQQVALLDNSSLSYLDDLVIGVPMLALETTGTTSYAATTAQALGFTGSGAHSLTVETWARPRVLPSGTNTGALVSMWDPSAAAANNAFRLYVDSAGLVSFSLAGDVAETRSTGITLKTNTWTHIAATFDASTKAITFYENGVLAGSSTSAVTTGVNATSARSFSVGAEFNGATAVDGFTGDISDVRVWQEARSAANVLANFEQRLALSGTVTNLVLNWKLDRESGGLTATTASSTPSGLSGTLTGATYVASLGRYFRPLSESICPSDTANGVYQGGAYECDFRASTAAGVTEPITIPSTLYAVYAKAWGAGGGGYNAAAVGKSPGGGGGFSGGLISAVNGTSLPGLSLNVYAGGYGAGSTADATGGNGAGGSGIFNSTSTAYALLAGGGGGGSYSANNVSGSGNCNTVLATAAQCGLGGNGGGYGATTVRAPDESSNCGGRGGDTVGVGSGPPQATDCPAPATGGDNSGKQGGGSTTGGGGGPSIVAGGLGYTASNSNRTGGGGGGGGLVGGEAGGYKNTGSANIGYGGGGGSGGVAASGVANATGAAGSYLGVFSDTSRTGTTKNGAAHMITNISPSVATANWQVGYSITGSNIPANTTITAVDTTNNTVTLSKAMTGGTNNGVALTVTYAGTAGSAVANSTDFYYSPSGLSSTVQNPGLGGSNATSNNGNGGAVVLIW